MPDEMGAFADGARVREAHLVQRLATAVELDRSVGLRDGGYE